MTLLYELNWKRIYLSVEYSTLADGGSLKFLLGYKLSQYFVMISEYQKKGDLYLQKNEQKSILISLGSPYENCQNMSKNEWFFVGVNYPIKIVQQN